MLILSKVEFESLCVLICGFYVKIKKCGEMARKLHFFKEQMLKAGISSSIKSTTRADNNMDDLEVCQDLYCFNEMKIVTYLVIQLVTPFFSLFGFTR